MATTPESEGSRQDTDPDTKEQVSEAPSKWRRLAWFVGLWGVSVFVLWLISLVIRWAIS